MLQETAENGEWYRRNGVVHVTCFSRKGKKIQSQFQALLLPTNAKSFILYCCSESVRINSILGSFAHIVQSERDEITAKDWGLCKVTFSSCVKHDYFYTVQFFVQLLSQRHCETNRPFATNDHMVQNPPCWRATSLLFPHWDIKTKTSQGWLVQISLF